MDTTKTPDPTAPEADAAPADLKKAEADRAAEAGTEARPEAEPAGAVTAGTDTDPDDDEFDEEPVEDEVRSAGVGSGAAAVAAAGLGLVALSGSWVSRVLAERQTLIGQIEGNKSAPPKDQIASLYGDAWHLTALANGVLATLALLLAVFVLARPAFGAPGRTLPNWVRAVAWAAVALGALGMIVFAVMYFLPLPEVPAAAQP
ncbi:hypothetical protein [Streptomyces subrutilus]|nr:hypothetical protein [Streptomyces subrutilus]QEU82840.1 hypothetical protein CP968_10220 [Streptomyces subrutilus]WSJ32216.1 hypothetical protein OG479_24690 [Streptomyces subrutilus]